MLEGVTPLETFPLVEWHEGELADVPSFTVLKTQICLTRPQCFKCRPTLSAHRLHIQNLECAKCNDFIQIPSVSVTYKLIKALQCLSEQK